MLDRWPARRSTLQRSWPALAISLLLHVALVVRLPQTGLGGERVQPAAAMAVRLLSAPPAEPAPAPDASQAPSTLTVEAPSRERRSEPRRADAPPTLQAATQPARATASPASAVARASPDAEYRNAASMDPGPKPLHEILPEFPPEAGMHDGVVVLRVLISAAGAVDGVEVLRSRPPGLFERSAVEAFMAARFSPGRVLGVAVKSQVTVEVEFTPFNRGADVSGRRY